MHQRHLEKKIAKHLPQKLNLLMNMSILMIIRNEGIMFAAFVERTRQHHTVHPTIAVD